MEYLKQDRDMLVALHQEVKDLKASLPDLLDLAAERGAARALNAREDDFNILYSKCNAIAVEQARVSSTITTLKWVGGIFIAVMAFATTYVTKFLGR